MRAKAPEMFGNQVDGLTEKFCPPKVAVTREYRELSDKYDKLHHLTDQLMITVGRLAEELEQIKARIAVA